MEVSTETWGTLERWSGTAVLAAGGAWVVDTALHLLELVVAVTVPGIVVGVLVLSALLLTLVGMLGFYPPLSERTPRVALVGALFVTGAGGLILGTLAWAVGAAVLGQSLPPGGVLAAILVLNVLALLSFGVASVRTGVPSRTAGVLVLALAGTWGVWLAGLVGLVESTPGWVSVVIGTVLAVLTLGIGYVLHANAAGFGEATPSSSPTVR